MVCHGLGVKPNVNTKEDASGNSFVRRMIALGGLVREKVRSALHHGVKRAMAVVCSGFEYNMSLIADGFTFDPRKTEEENEAACLGRLARLFEDEVLPPADVEGL
jgi:hypothetical protein